MMWRPNIGRESLVYFEDRFFEALPNQARFLTNTNPIGGYVRLINNGVYAK